MILKMDKKHLDLIKTYCKESFPNECCGFLLGRQKSGDKEVLSALPALNASEEHEKYHRFLITPETFLRGEKIAKERNMDIVGFYHSHPNAEAKPSAYDIDHAWPWYSYVIVSVKNNHVENVTSWQLKDDRSDFQKEEIVLV